MLNQAMEINILGLDATRVHNALAVMQEDDSVDMNFMVAEALRLYEAFIMVTKEKNGHFKRYFNAAAKQAFPVVDFPAHSNTQAGIKITFQTMTANTLYRIEKMRELQNFKTNEETIKQAILFYSDRIIEEYNGWMLVQYTPGGPQGGLPIFGEDSNETQSGNIIHIRNYGGAKTKLLLN